MSQVIIQTIEGHNLRELIESNAYVGRFGYKYIKMPNSRLDFSAEFVYLGFTKAGNPKFGEIISSGPERIKIQKRIGKFDGRYLILMGGLYLKSTDEMREDAYQ